MLGQLIILVTAFAATVSATPQMPELPECATTCVIPAILASGCGFSDPACLCIDAGLKQATTTCLPSTCPESDLPTIYDFVNSICEGQPGSPIGGDAATSTPPATSRSPTSAPQPPVLAPSPPTPPPKPTAAAPVPESGITRTPVEEHAGHPTVNPFPSPPPAVVPSKPPPPAAASHSPSPYPSSPAPPATPSKPSTTTASAYPPAPPTSGNSTTTKLSAPVETYIGAAGALGVPAAVVVVVYVLAAVAVVF